MKEQLNILDVIEAERRADEGLERSVNKADRDNKDWSDRCWDLFKKWLSKKQPGFHFMIEEFRNDCFKWGKIEKPNSNTAFGFLSKRAEKQNLITGAGTAKTKSINSHGTPANVWIKV